MKLLGLDLGTHTGYCVANLEDNVLSNIRSGVKDFSLEDKASGLLFNNFELWLKQLLISERPMIAVAEKPHHRGGASTRKLVGLFAIFEKVCEAMGIQYADVHTGTLKVICCGHGKARKEDIKKWVKRMFGFSPTSDDESDAIAVCFYAATEFCDFKQKRSIDKMGRELKSIKKKKKKDKAEGAVLPLGLAVEPKTKNQKKFVKAFKPVAEEYGQMSGDIEKLFNGTKSAAPALRKKLQVIKNGVLELRKLALAIQKDI